MHRNNVYVRNLLAICDIAWLLSTPPCFHVAISEMWCWSGGRETLRKKSCLCLSIVYHYNGAQWYKQFLQVGRLDTVDNAWFNSSVSSVFMVFTIVPFFTLLIGELSLMGLALDLVEQPLFVTVQYNVWW